MLRILRINSSPPAMSAVAAEDRSIHRVQRPVTQRFEDLVAVSGDRGGDDQDRTGALLHDLASRFDAVHDRHDQVHQHEVGPIGLAFFDRLLTVFGDPGHFGIGQRDDDAAQNFDRHLDIVDNRDANQSISPIRSATVLMNESS